MNIRSFAGVQSRAVSTGIGAIALALSIPIQSHAQPCPSWVQRTPPHAPGPRTFAAMAYDEARGVTVLYGGSLGNGSSTDETWEWNGTDWTLRAATGPGARCCHAMAYNAGRHVTVLFGGADRVPSLIEPYGDTWEWNGISWTFRPALAPNQWGRVGHAMAYDSVRSVVVLFGGDGNDVWDWNGVAWSHRATSLGPLGRHLAAMAFDADRDQMVVFGGTGSSGCVGDTWELNGNTWTQRANSGPAQRYAAAMAYFGGSRQRAVLFGGTCTSPFGDTYRWNGTNWAQLAIPGPSAHASPLFAFDRAREVIVMFGGDPPDTWEFRWGIPGFTQQPVAQSSCIGGDATFTAVAHGTVPLTYQWRKGGIDIAGATGPTLTISPVSTSDVGNYDVVVTGVCGTVTSTPAHLTVFTSVAGDVDGSGRADGADISTFVSLLLTSPGGPASPAFCAADIYQDGRLDSADVTAFVGLLISGT